MNERLRSVMVRRGVAIVDLANDCGVDPKTVERWLSLGRLPHRRHRWAAARRLGAEEAYLWPEVAESGRRGDAPRAELVELYPDRASVPRSLWLRLLAEVRECLDVLVCAGTFLGQVQPRLARTLTERAEVGVRVRLCFADPDSDAVAVRDVERGLGGTLPALVRASLTNYRDVASVSGCEVRLHATTLYASVFRFDEDLLVNAHAYGEAGSANPVFHFRRVEGGGLFEHYLASFDRVWAAATQWPEDSARG